MKIFLAGATGAIGKRLVPLLVSSGHHVLGTTRDAGKVDSLLAIGAEPVILDALDREAVMKTVLSARPDAIIHELTDLSNSGSMKNIDKELAGTNRLRIEATQHLLAAARAAGVRRFVAQSYGAWPNIREGGRVKTELDPIDPNPPSTMRKTLDAIRTLERLVLEATDVGGIVLRYGGFYGPGTSLGAEGKFTEMVRQRKLPVVGNGAGVWSFIHIDDAAAATQIAVEGHASGIFNIVDDEPAEVSLWLPDLAQALGAKPPHHLPAWLGYIMLGEGGMSMMTKVRGSSNAKAKRELGWRPHYASWRDGFRNGLSAPLPTAQHRHAVAAR